MNNTVLIVGVGGFWTVQRLMSVNTKALKLSSKKPVSLNDPQ